MMLGAISLLSDPRATEFKIHLREFRLMPTNLDRSVNIGNGTIIHTSRDIVTLSKNVIENHPSTKVVSNKLLEMIDNSVIIIGYIDRSKFKFLKRKLNTFLFGSEFTLGTYLPHLNKILIILDNNVSFIGKSILEIPNLIIHELIHMAYNGSQIKYGSVERILLKYYTKLISNIYCDLYKYFSQTTDIHPIVNIHETDKNLSKLLFKLYESKRSKLTIDQYIEILDKIWSNIFTYTAEKCTVGLVDFAEYASFLTDSVIKFWLHKRNINSSSTKFDHLITNNIFDELLHISKHAYSALGMSIHKSDAGSYQTIGALDEVIALYATEFGSSDTTIQNIINNMRV